MEDIVVCGAIVDSQQMQGLRLQAMLPHWSFWFWNLNHVLWNTSAGAHFAFLWVPLSKHSLTILLLPRAELVWMSQRQLWQGEGSALGPWLMPCHSQMGQSCSGKLNNPEDSSGSLKAALKALRFLLALYYQGLGAARQKRLITHQQRLGVSFSFASWANGKTYWRLEWTAACLCCSSCEGQFWTEKCVWFWPRWLDMRACESAAQSEKSGLVHSGWFSSTSTLWGPAPQRCSVGPTLWETYTQMWVGGRTHQ